MIDEVFRAVCTVECMSRGFLLAFSAHQNGCLDSAILGDSFIVRINEKRRRSLDPTSTVFVNSKDLTGAHFVWVDFFLFRLVVIRVFRLDETLVGLLVDVLKTERTLSSTTDVLLFVSMLTTLWIFRFTGSFIDFSANKTFFLDVAEGFRCFVTNLVLSKTVLSEESAVAVSTDDGR